MNAEEELNRIRAVHTGAFEQELLKLCELARKEVVTVESPLIQFLLLAYKCRMAEAKYNEAGWKSRDERIAQLEKWLADCENALRNKQAELQVAQAKEIKHE